MTEIIIAILIFNMISIIVSIVGLHELVSPPDSNATPIQCERYVFWHEVYWQCILINLVALMAFLVFFFFSNTGIGIAAVLAWGLITAFGNMSVYCKTSDKFWL